MTGSLIHAAVFLVFTACMGHQCHEVNGGKFDSVLTCTIAAQPTVAHWLERHPDYDEAKLMTCGPEPADEGDEL